MADKKRSKKDLLRDAFNHWNSGTNFMAAVAYGQWGKVRFLARMGACVYERKSYVIAKIGECGDPETLKVVLKRGASLKATDNYKLGLNRGEQALVLAKF